jgi:hypothetical protein
MYCTGTFKSNKQKNLEKKTYFLLASCQAQTNKVGSGSVSKWHGSADPDLYLNVTDPQHWYLVFYVTIWNGPQKHPAVLASLCEYTFLPLESK